MRAFAALALLALLAAAACSTPAATPTPIPAPTVAPTPTFRPAVPPTAAVPTLQAQSTPGMDEEDPGDVEAAFLSNVDDLIAEATDLSVTPCEDLVRVTRNNPNLVSSLRGFAATLKRASTSQPTLGSEAVKAAIADLDHTMGQLDGALSLCGIPSSGQP